MIMLDILNKFNNLTLENLHCKISKQANCKFSKQK